MYRLTIRHFKINLFYENEYTNTKFICDWIWMIKGNVEHNCSLQGEYNFAIEYYSHNDTPG